MMSCSQAHESTARRCSRALFAVRPGFVPSLASAIVDPVEEFPDFLPAESFDRYAAAPLPPLREGRLVFGSRSTGEVGGAEVLLDGGLERGWHR